MSKRGDEAKQKRAEKAEPDVELSDEQKEAAEELAGTKGVPMSKEEYQDLQEMVESEEGDEREIPWNEPRVALEKNSSGHYRMDDKVMLIKYMEAFQRPFGFEDEMVPQYAQIGRLFGVNPRMLHHWWHNRDEILAKHQQWFDSVPTMMEARLSVELMRQIDHITTLDYEEIGLANFIDLLQLTMQMHRLYTGQSTENVAQKVEHKVIHVAPDQAQAGELPPGGNDE